MWKLGVAVFIPAGNTFTLGASLLGGSDSLGVPNFEVGQWVYITCDTGSITIKQGYQQPHPLSNYETGTCELSLVGHNWSPSFNDKIVPGVHLKVVATKDATSSQFSNQYTTQFTSDPTNDTEIVLFYGTIQDAEEDYSQTATDDKPDTLRFNCVDCYLDVVRLKGYDIHKNVAFAGVPSILESWGLDVAIDVSTNPTISVLRNTQDNVERLARSVYGVLYVDEDHLVLKDTWPSVPVMSISDVHEGTHLCYYSFERSNKLSNVMNSVTQTNVYDAESSYSDGQLQYNELSYTATQEDAASVLLYGSSGDTTTVSRPDWSAESYIDGGKVPQTKVRSVKVRVNANLLAWVPKLFEAVTFTHKGTTETRVVSNRTLTLTPKRWDCELAFFDFVPATVTPLALRALPTVLNPKEVLV